MQFIPLYYKLDNGVRILEVPMEGHESVTALILAKTGSRNEKIKQAGISHVLEHMLFKGTKSYPEPLDIASAIESMGAQVNAFTDKEYTGYYIKAASEHLPRSLSILSEMLFKPTLREDHLEREKGVIIEEINMYEDKPMEKVSEEYENLLYGGELGRSIIGTKKTVSAVTPDDLRKYLNKWYRGSNILVILAGGVPKGSKSILEDSVGQAKTGEIMDYVSKGIYGSEMKMHIKKDTEQAHFVLGVPGLSLGDERLPAWKILQIVLGGNMSSRLFTEIREKRGLAYYVRAEVERYSDVGHLIVRAGVKLDSLDEAISVVKKELFKIGSDITKKELSEAKSYYRGLMALSLEDSMGVAQFLADNALIRDEVRDLEEVQRQMENVTLDDIKAVSEELLSEEKIRTVVLGPKSSV